jgi:hypothetical protein
MLILTLDDKSNFDITINSNPVSEYIIKSFRHLQHLPIPFHIYDYPKYYSSNKDLMYSNLISSADKLGVEIDVLKLTNQDYLNYLHKVYETGYNKGTNIWLEFHEMIHLIESLNNKNKHSTDQIIINFRDSAGPLEKSFDKEYLAYSAQTITKGTCFCQWSELGKVPIQYWMDNEPDNIQRLCQLAKPWTILRPSFIIALEDIDFRLSPEKQQGFNEWFAKHKQVWMQHWKLDSWSEAEMNSVIPIGQVKDISLLVNKIHSGRILTKIAVR